MRFSSSKAVLAGVLVMVICGQLYWMFWPRLNSLSDPYRLAERKRALREWGQERTLASKAALDREHQLLEDHLRHIEVFMIAAAVIESVAVVFILRCAVSTNSHPNAARPVLR